MGSPIRRIGFEYQQATPDLIAACAYFTRSAGGFASSRSAIFAALISMAALQSRPATCHVGMSVSYLYSCYSTGSQPHPIIVWGVIYANHSKVAAMNGKRKCFCLFGGLLLKSNYAHPYKVPGKRCLAKISFHIPTFGIKRI